MTTAVLVSGGVDSSVALLRLVESGEHDLRAYYLKVWLEDELAGLGECPWEEDVRFAASTCELLGVPLEIVPLQREYRNRIVEETVAELRAGRTPSPDVLCNRRIKMGAFLDHLPDDARVATGHWARTRRRGGSTRLLTSRDPVKDQTYFLSQLEQEQLARCIFPIGDSTKDEVRRIAAARGLPAARRPDSQGICFLGRVPFPAFVAANLGDRPGPIVEATTGDVLGEHRGVWFHTVGQRRGLGLSGGPWYVVDKDLDTDTIVVVHGDRLAGTARRRLLVPRPHWISAPPTSPELSVKVRHGPSIARCAVELSPEGLVVDLERPDPGLAAGQYAALYDDGECLGGGMFLPLR